ncbi:hypothetical protein [Leminorella grimontii]|uniref:hypothetical protein n=1 Tax=Leminorella grimontii TaxID=82981 RepID=UPI002084B63B|nr:hypothetical protein [Leminorella grimontii]GKX60735.1 hypothetical protein SOASR031_30500 [Leminorella grimontii]
MNDGLKRDNVNRILKELIPDEEIDEKKYVHCLVRPYSFFSMIMSIITMGKPAVMYFAEKEIILLYLTMMYDYSGEFKTIPYDDVPGIDCYSLGLKKTALLRRCSERSLDITMPIKCLGCSWQSENLTYLSDNKFFQESWPRSAN